MSDPITRLPRWYQTAVIYELHVRSFADSDNDGIGDFRGLVAHLDYLEDLGVNALWLLPFYPSPLKDGGYDIADYTNVNPVYGTIDDFRVFLDEAHRRGIKVITELVINHTSSQHPWFERARRAPKGHPDRDFYVWSDTPQRYPDARVIFKDFETSNWTYDPIADAYYWHRFYSHQPDLNFDNPRVHQAVFDAMDFWLSMGVDGMRLDAVPYLYERDGSSCENLEETHAFLKKLRAHVDAKFADRMLLAEANQWPEDAARYFGQGDECHMNFHFPLMPRMFMSLYMEDRFPIVDILRQTPEIPEDSQWALFLRNHDELTLEMVTDEDRDSMWRVYAQDTQARINLGIRRRLAPLLRSRRKVELMNSLLFSLPGTPVIYYGDELGMGDNFYLGDRDGVRTPMQWSPDRNAGFSRANPQSLFLPVVVDPEYHYQSLNVETQQANPSSLLWWMKRLIAVRKNHPSLGRGTIEFITPRNRSVIAFLRSIESERVLIVANLSRHAQHVELDLSAHAGCTPEELFGRERFSTITDKPYVLTLPAYAFFWLSLEPPIHASDTVRETPPKLGPVAAWRALFMGPERTALEKILPRYISRQRWFRAKSRRVSTVSVKDFIDTEPLPDESALVFMTVTYFDGETDEYFVPLAATATATAAEFIANHPDSIVATVNLGGQDATLHDAMLSPAFSTALLKLSTRLRPLDTTFGHLVASPCLDLEGPAPAPSPTLTEQTNTTVFFDQRYVLKIFRLIEPGINPDVELTLHLQTNNPDVSVPTLLASLEYHRPKRLPASLVTVQHYIDNRGDAWSYTLESLGLSLEHAVARPSHSPAFTLPQGPIVSRSPALPPDAETLLSNYLPFVRLLARRTADIHRTLASPTDDPALCPEPFTELHQRSIYQYARTSLLKSIDALSDLRDSLSDECKTLAQKVITATPMIESRLRRVTSHKIDAMRIRCHGDLHLGQVLRTDGDVVILDFEGEPLRSLSERRYKRNPLLDVAGMLRSFDYAAVTVEHRQHNRTALLHEATRAWVAWAQTVFVTEYLSAIEGTKILSPNITDWETLLRFYILEKNIYELRYELSTRPDSLYLPLEGLVAFIEET